MSVRNWRTTINNISVIDNEDLTDDVPPEFQAEYSDDQLINYAQNLRRKLISKVMTSEESLNDPDNRKELKELLSDISITSIQNKRIAAKENENADMRQVALLLAQVSAKTGSGNPFRSEGGNIPPRGLDTSLLENIPINPGLLEIGNVQETKEAFLNRMEGKS